jgi:hypothetical protein
MTDQDHLDESDAQGLVSEYFAALNRADLNAVTDRFGPNGELLFGGVRHQGTRAIRNVYETAVFVADDLHADVVSIIVDGSNVMVDVTFTIGGEAMSIPHLFSFDAGVIGRLTV